MRTGVRYAAVIVLAGAAAYATSFSGPFLFDDQTAVVTNPQIRQLSPLSVPLSPPHDTPVAGRPLVNLTLAVNYAMGGLDVRSYHVTNLAFHLLAALAVFGIVRRTLRLRSMPAEMTSHADGLALVCALIWTLHPLNTEVVDYIAQRSESLMGLCYLLTLYCSIRAHDQPEGWRWRIAAVAACGAGMASKESMVTAPLMVALYDRAFLYPSLGAAFRARRTLYLGLALTGVGLAGLLLGKPRATVGFEAGVDPWTYFLNQLGLIGRYLWLSVWPRSLVIDYGLPKALGVGDIVVPGLIVAALAVLTVAVLRFRPALGFLGLWFFLTLGPTSSVVPIATEVGAERRMYLPLIALVVLGVVGVFRLLATRHLQGSRVPVAVAGVVCLVLAAGTVARTQEYQTVRSIAQTTVDRYPHGRARFALANELIAAGQHPEGLAQLQLAVKDYPPAHYGLATEMAVSGRMDDAVTEAREFIRLVPESPAVNAARDLMGRALALQGKYEPAAEQFLLLEKALPNEPGPRISLGDIRLRQRRLPESIASYEAALTMRPGDPDTLADLGLALAAAGRMREASIALGGAVTARPDDIRLLNLWGRTLAAEGRYVDAVVPMRRLVELAPSDRQAADNLVLMERLAAQQRAALAAAPQEHQIRPPARP